MSIASLIARVTTSQRHRSFFHFTDSRNVPSILQHGLLSWPEAERRNLVVPAPGGNDVSRLADRSSGVDDYVHLCFDVDHPMEYRARLDGRISQTTWLKINPDVLRTPGVRITLEVANKANAEILTIDDAFGRLDLDILFTKTNWSEPAIRERLSIARKYEILVPRIVPTHLIST